MRSELQNMPHSALSPSIAPHDIKHYTHGFESYQEKLNWDSTPKYHPNPRNINEMLSYNIYEELPGVTYREPLEIEGKYFFDNDAYERYKKEVYDKRTGQFLQIPKGQREWEQDLVLRMK